MSTNTCAQTSNDSTNYHHGKVDGSSLQGRSDAENHHATETCPATTQSVVDGASQERETDELTSIEDGGDESNVARRRKVEDLLKPR